MDKKKEIGILVLIAVIVAVFIGLSMSGILSNPEGKLENPTQPIDETRPVKEFSMQSFTEIIDGKYFPQYSLKEITVKKGDLVRIKITVTKGTHDFKIDEYDVYADTLLDQEITVEFVADKTGEFIYYCTKPGHRQNGHWGTLKVLE